MRATAQIEDAIKKTKEVIFVSVSARPATTGMNALTDGMSFPKKIHHIPRREKVAWSALCIFVKVASSNMRIFLARGLSYFLIRRKVMMLPSVLPRAPTITVGIKRSDPVLTKYPQMM